MKTTIKAKSSGLIAVAFLASMIAAATPAAAQWRGPAVWGPRPGPWHAPAWRPGPWPGPGWAWRAGYWSGGVWYNGWWAPTVVAGAAAGVTAGGSSPRLPPRIAGRTAPSMTSTAAGSGTGPSTSAGRRRIGSTGAALRRGLPARQGGPWPMRPGACRLRAIGGPPRPPRTHADKSMTALKEPPSKTRPSPRSPSPRTALAPMPSASRRRRRAPSRERAAIPREASDSTSARVPSK
jgi:hypothetical protein